MGQAKIKQHNRKQFLLDHPVCCYCGAAATTADHCPPRSFFVRRQWPEGFEFPACQDCNADSRLDEQALAVVTRIKVGTEMNEVESGEWERLLSGLKNTQPAMLAEFFCGSEGSVTRKQAFRKNFGPLGDKLRREGYEYFKIGPLLSASIDRFMRKLGQALYYRHCNQMLRGKVFAIHISSLSEAARSGKFNDLVQFSPSVTVGVRSGKSLIDSFIYRFGCDVKLGALIATVRFSEQMIFQIMALREDALAKVIEEDGGARRWAGGFEVPSGSR